MISSLRDGLAVAKNGIKLFKQNNLKKNETNNPPKGCQHFTSEWTNFYGEKLFEFIFFINLIKN
jgi:hypothetical protein